MDFSLQKAPFKKLRLWLAYPFAVFCLLSAYKYGFNFNYGLWFIGAGMFIRFWAAGVIEKRRILAVAGPYAYVRNPLYAGNFLIGLGFCLFINHFLVRLVFIVLFAFLYRGTIREEEELLTALFGQEYRDYKNAVAAFVPRRKRYFKARNTPFSVRRAFRNGEFIRAAALAVLLSLLALFHYLRTGKSAGPDLLVRFLAVAGFFTLILFGNIFLRRSLACRKKGLDAT